MPVTAEDRVIAYRDTASCSSRRPETPACKSIRRRVRRLHVQQYLAALYHASLAVQCTAAIRRHRNRKTMSMLCFDPMHVACSVTIKREMKCFCTFVEPLRPPAVAVQY